MKAPFSEFLDGLTPWIRRLIRVLDSRYDYVSVLSTDSVGFSVTISQ